MERRRAAGDDTLARLQTLTARLKERIGEGEDVRARLTRALTASAWPDVRSAVRHLSFDDGPTD